MSSSSASELPKAESNGAPNGNESPTSERMVAAPVTELRLSSSSDEVSSSSAVAEGVLVDPHEELNMCSAFTHLLADTMRTVTVLASSLLTWLGHTDSVQTDAIGSVVVGVVVLAIAVFVLYEAVVQTRTYLIRKGGPDADVQLLEQRGLQRRSSSENCI